MTAPARSSDATAYLVVIGCAVVALTGVCVALVLLWQSFFARGNLTWPDAGGGVAYGLVAGGFSSAFLVVATLPLLRSIRRRRTLFVLLSAVSPVSGWVLFGFIESLVTGYSNVSTYAIVGVVTSVISGLVANLAALVLDR
jgi:hypothetical protein